MSRRFELNPMRVRAMARKEALHVLRDSRSLAAAIALPMLLLVLFGFALSLDVNNVPLAIWDASNTPQSRALLASFTGSRYFSLRLTTDNYHDLERALDRRDATVALVIPPDYARRLESQGGASVQLIADASDANTATLAMGYAEALVAGVAQNIMVERRERAGQPPLRQAVELVPRVWYNPQLTGVNYVVPGLIAIIMMVIAATLTSGTIAREWERNTMEQLLTTPVSSAEVILGKMIPYFAIGILDMTLAVLMGKLLFDVPLRGSVLLLFIMGAWFMMGALGLGILISTVARNQLVAHEMAMMMTFLPAFLLSGFTFAIRNMPDVLQLATYLVPAKYFMVLLRGIYLKGVGVNVLWEEAILMVAFGTGLFLIAIAKFRKKLV
jgi:ABC-2 type transport system permease protein